MLIKGSTLQICWNLSINLNTKYSQESGMFDIKTEVASPAASKEEEDEEDEVTFSKSIVKEKSSQILQPTWLKYEK